MLDCTIAKGAIIPDTGPTGKEHDYVRTTGQCQQKSDRLPSPYSPLSSSLSSAPLSTRSPSLSFRNRSEPSGDRASRKPRVPPQMPGGFGNSLAIVAAVSSGEEQAHDGLNFFNREMV